MGKNKRSKDDDNQYPGGNPVEEEYKASDSGEDIFAHSEIPADEVCLVFKGNRKKELHIGNKMYTFIGRERVSVPRSVIEHKDFENQAKYFLVKE